MFPNQIDKLLQPFNVHFAFTKHILHKKTQMHDSQYSTNDKPKYSKNKMQVNYTKKKSYQAFVKWGQLCASAIFCQQRQNLPGC